MTNSSYLGWWKGTGSRQWFLCPKGDCGIEEKGSICGVIDKKRRYWPKYIDGEAIIQHFQDKEVGATDALPGVLDDVPIQVHCMKEPDYVMMPMSSYGTLSECGEIKNGTSK